MESTQDYQPQKWSRKLKLAIVLSCVVLILFIGCLVWFMLRTHSTVRDHYQASSVAVGEPVKVTFNQSFLKFDVNSIKITPDTRGSWKMRQSLLAGDTLEFSQDQPLKPGTAYTVDFGNVTRISGVKANVAKMSFTTELAPGIEKVSFQSKQTLAADAGFTVTLSRASRGLRDLQLVTKPAITLSRSTVDDTTFTWKPSGLLPQGKNLSISLVDTKSGQTLLEQKLNVAQEPIVKERVKASHFEKTDVATIRFSQPIEQDSGKIKFNVDGTGVWESENVYKFTPKSVAPGKTYTYIIPKGLKSKRGGITTKTQTYRFSTPGAVRVIAMSPYGQELSQARQTIRFTFDQQVDQASAESRVHVSSGKVTSKAWEGNTLVLKATNLGAQRTVRTWVDSGVRPIFGLPSVSDFGLSFTTEIPVKKLGVPMYYQQYAQSCEAASVRMALAYKGAGSPSDWSILQRFGYDPRPMDKKKSVWDDPQQQFVGDVKGSQGDGTGWGVYAEPVAKAVRSYGRGAVVRYGVSRGFVADQIYKGNPVVLWGIWNESAVQKSWKTPAGRKVTGPVPMHVRLVVGVKGKASDPIGFYVHDPITGPTYWTAGYLEHNVSRAGAANQAVAIQ